MRARSGKFLYSPSRVTTFNLPSAVCSTVSTGARKFAANASKCSRAGGGERCWGGEPGGHPHLGGRVRHRCRGGHHDRAVAVADRGSQSVRARIAFGALRSVGHRQPLAVRLEGDVLGEVGLVDDEHADAHRVEVGGGGVFGGVGELFELGAELGQLVLDAALLSARRAVVSVSTESKSARRRSMLALSTSATAGWTMRWSVGADRGVEVAGGDTRRRTRATWSVTVCVVRVRGEDPRCRIQAQVVAGELLDHVAGDGEQGGAVDPPGAAGLVRRR